ncbi:DUF262 domain-containing protein [Lentibacter algarum]|uniref:DUF262 domain-containing protein n=1 Tax=Lentibacter algarum TaxID=576131 RepID=UPI001C07AA5E|nr:DUF262 domain-containing protein [Lentibacter algarum]MBU2981359.1 DUF262 domain-containing protein [Lentibacter algarum]
MDRVDYQSLIVQDLINDHKEKKLDLNPWYQRRSVWSTPQKSYLVNTLLERKPIPAIYIRHAIDLDAGKSVKEVVDGQQRSRGIIEFCQDAFSTKMPDGKTRKTYSQLTPSEREKFLLTPLPVGYLLGADDRDVIDIFARMNSVSKSLNPQEKRNAKYSGEFKQFALRKAIDYLGFWRATNVFTTNDIARMGEVQFVADIVLNLLGTNADFTQPRLDRLYDQYEDEFDRADEISNRLEAVFQKLAEVDEKAIKNTIFRRQPIFWSLVLILDELGPATVRDLEDKLYRIDAEVTDEQLDTEEIRAFRTAIQSTTQRTPSRTTRKEFLISRLA